MKKIRLFLSALVLFMMILPTSFATPVFIFSDVNELHQNFDAINYLKEKGVVVGYGDGTFAPGKTINRAEFLKIVMMAGGHISSGSGCFNDVSDQWFSSYVCFAAKNKFVSGYPDGNFLPANNINFVEAAKIVANVMELEIPEKSTDEDWYSPYVKALEEHNALPVSISAFSQEVTRAEMAEMIWRIALKRTDLSSTTYENIKNGVKLEEVTQDSIPDDNIFKSAEVGLKNFASCKDLNKYVEDNLVAEMEYYELLDKQSDTGIASPETQSAEESSTSKSAEVEYSETNVQVAGVDEADIVKTDGTYIYFVKGTRIHVVKAYPPNSMEEVAIIEISDGNDYLTVREMYLGDGKLSVVAERSAQLTYDIDTKASSLVPTPSYHKLTEVYVFDVKDPKAFKLSRKIALEGDYLSSRKIGEEVFVVANRYNYYWTMKDNNGADILPLYADSAKDNYDYLAQCGDVMYRPSGYSPDFIVVAGVPTDSTSEVKRKVIMGSTTDIYASTKNLYLVEPRFTWGYDELAEKYQDETVVHKFSLTGILTYKGHSVVPGLILNQFSMDEHGDNFRIATTSGEVWDAEDPSTNSLYVLNKNMEMTGKIEGIAPGEKIYSVRFMGDRAYLVTFKKIDPFFVIDLKDPTKPAILGKLKIPGYSDYLHPYDENHIIGIGKDTAEPTEAEASGFWAAVDFAWYQGMKIAMFDVTDVANPVELHKEIIGDRGTSSELLYNHKALLFDKSKGIMAFPVTLAELSDEVKNNPEASKSEYGNFVFQGAYVYDVSVENGFKLRGKITHYADDEIAKKAGYYWQGEKDIKRILYIGNYFYTVSNELMRANAMTGLEFVNEIEME